MRVGLWVCVKAVVVLALAVGVAWAADQPQSDATAAKKDVPLYDGKPGTKIGDVCINPKDGAEMVWVPAGEFLMGVSDEDIAALLTEHSECTAESFADEKPQRKVYLDGYWVYRFEVTVAQYRKFCEATANNMPKAPSWGWKDNHPIAYVTWDDASTYAKWAGASLPTEAQWEKAARGTDGRAYPWGNKWDASKCANVVEKELKSTQPVGSYVSGATPYGCMDMAGNVYEWCADWYHPNYYNKAPGKNPTGPSEAAEFKFFGATISGVRVLRGGSWDDYHYDYFRCAYRDWNVPTIRLLNIGFRCARTP